MISEKKLSTEQYQQKMEQRKKIQEQRLVEASKKKGLIIINTGHGKGKTTAALGMVLRSLGHGFQVAIIQFVKGAWEPAEKSIFKSFGKQIEFYAMEKDLHGKLKIEKEIFLKPKKHGKKAYPI
mgnify:CR=1 FL=1